MKFYIKINILNFRNRVVACLMFCACVLYPFAGASAEDLSSPEYAIKAAFLYNFVKYVDWPEPTSSDTSQNICQICVLGKDPFGNDLKSIEGKTVQSRTIKIDQVDISNGDAAFQRCHVLFISRSEKNVLPEIIEKLDGYPILTVTDLDDTSNSGAIINLITVGDRVRFEINLKTARRVGIKISSQLLKLATRVTE